MKRFAYLDIEATHTNWSDAKIIEIAFIIKDENGADLDYFQSLINPNDEVTPQITELTGITNEMLSGAPEFYQVAPKIIDKLADCIIVAHKAEFDYELLKKELELLNHEFVQKKICTLNLTKRMIPELPSYSLQNLCDLLQIKLNSHHRALDDAHALAKLHHYLRLIGGELNQVESYLNEHKKLIKKTPTLPGVIIFKNGKTSEVIKTENLNLTLKELLLICPKNKMRLTQRLIIEIKPSSTLIEAGLIKSKMEHSFYPYCLYTVKNKEGKILLRVGKTDPKKPALYYTHSRKEALNLLNSMVRKNEKIKYAYKESQLLKSEIIRENLELEKELQKLTVLNKNYLVRSHGPRKGVYSYFIMLKNRRYAAFTSKKLIKNSEDLSGENYKLKKMSPREFMSMNYSLKWIRNQRAKTDIVIEISDIKTQKKRQQRQ